MPDQKHLIVIGGATATGKTSASIQLAQHFQTEIISADSRQFYQEMSIGTAKPDESELQSVKHHFINSLSIEEEYSVGAYEREATSLLKNLFHDHDVLILVGGSGLFIKAVCEGLDEFPEVPEEINNALKKLFDSQGIQPLQEELHIKDPSYATEVDLNNPVRLIRALGVCRASGIPYSSFRNGKKAKRDFTPIYLQMVMEREALYEKINLRVEKMMELGLLEEAQKLLDHREKNALQTVGYQELFDYFDGRVSLEEAVELIKRNSRRYAKRQMTWFRKNEQWKGFQSNDLSSMLAYLHEKIRS